MTTSIARMPGRLPGLLAGRRFRIALPFVLVAMSGLAVVGCDEGDATVAALNQARVALNKVSLPSTPVTEWETGGDPAEAALSKVVTDLRPISDSGSAGQKEAASLLMAQAQLGIGDRRAAYASLAEREALAALTPIRSRIDAMLGMLSRSGALMAYDAGPTIQQLEGMIRAKDAEIGQRQRDRAQIEADILLLRQGAEERMTMAAAKRDEAARMAVAAMSLSAHDAGVQMQQVHTMRRESDTIELDGANLLARAEVRQPELAERELMVGQVVSQKEELVAALAATRTRATESQAQAATHATAAATLAAEIDGLISDALTYRTNVADARVAAAVDAYTAAQNFARGAGDDGTGLEGSAAQGRGDTLWLRAQNIQHMADLLEQLAALQVPANLTGGSADALRGTLASYAARAQQLRGTQRQALSEAAEAYQDARDSFGRVRGGDETTRARVNRLTQLMDLCRRGANGQAIDLSTITDEQATFNDEAPAAEEPAAEPTEGAEGGEGEQTTGG